MNTANQTGTPLKRTDYCGALRAADEGREVVLCGWVHKTRDMGHLVFVDLRDREGLAQVVFQSDRPDLAEEAKKLRGEFVVGVRGTVTAPLLGQQGHRHGRGRGRSRAQLHIFAASKVPPFVVADPPQASEETAAEVPLPGPAPARDAAPYPAAAPRPPWPRRNYSSRHGFLEIETPILAKSDARGRPRLPGPQPDVPRPLLRPAPVAPAVQADS